MSLARAVVSADAPSPSGPYSQAVIADGPTIFLAGQRPVEPGTGSVPEDFTAQVEQSLRNVQAVLKSAGADLSSVVKVTAYLADLSYFESLNETFRSWFSEPFPARTTVGARLREVLVELDVTAALPSPNR